MAPTQTNETAAAPVKLTWQTILTLVSWIVLVAVAFSALETQTHAEKTYLRKDVFEQFAKSNENSLQEIKQMLRNIDGKLDQKQDKKKEGF